jgi:hypothetical protein
MAITILAGTFGGIQLDKKVKMQFPLFTIIFSLAAVALALYLVLKDLINK